MAKIKANKRPVKTKRRTVFLTGTCSNCRAKKVECVKVKHAQLCVEKCVGGVTYDAPEVSVPGIPQAIINGLLGTSA